MKGRRKSASAFSLSVSPTEHVWSIVFPTHRFLLLSDFWCPSTRFLNRDERTITFLELLAQTRKIYRSQKLNSYIDVFFVCIAYQAPGCSCPYQTRTFVFLFSTWRPSIFECPCVRRTIKTCHYASGIWHHDIKALSWRESYFSLRHWSKILSSVKSWNIRVSACLYASEK